MQNLPTGLNWQGKKTEVERIVLPFQPIEVSIDKSRVTREEEKKTGFDMFKFGKSDAWYNRLLWGSISGFFELIKPRYICGI